MNVRQVIRLERAAESRGYGNYNYNCLKWFLTAFLLGAGGPGLLKADELQGQSAGSTTWITGNLQGWKELDYVPGRIVLTDGPVTNKAIVITFDHTKAGMPGIEFLGNFTPSANVQITSGPTLSAPVGVDTWSYKLTVNVLDAGTAGMEFRSRLAAGSHLGANASVRLPFKMLQISKPGVRAGTPDLTVTTAGAVVAHPGEVLTHTLNYQNGQGSSVTATGVQLSDVLPDGVEFVPGSASPPAAQLGNLLVWDLGNLAPGSVGTVSYSVKVAENAVPGQVFSTTATLLSGENDANPADNQSSLSMMIYEDPAVPAAVKVRRGAFLADQTFLLEFDTVSNCAYTVQYSADLVHWKTVPGTIKGCGSAMQWIDDGSPKTECAPCNARARFYRIVTAP